MAWLKLGLHHGFVYYHGGIPWGDPVKTPDFDRAIIDFSKAIELDPDYEFAWLERGKEYLLAHDFDNAVSDFSKAIELDPTDFTLWGIQAEAYQRKGDPIEAIVDFDKVIELPSQRHA